MSLATLFHGLPILTCSNSPPRRRRFARPMLRRVLDRLEDQIGQRVRQVPGKKRKLRSGAVSSYEPKSKVVVTNKDNKFKISMDSFNYQPDEITVLIVNDHKLAISAKHEAKDKDVYECSEMFRSFDLPENVDANAITFHMSSLGQFTVEAPLKALPESSGRNIPIEIEGKDQQDQSSQTNTCEKNSKR